MVIHLLKESATDDIIADIDIQSSCYVKLWTLSPFEIANELWLEALRCPHVYDGYVLERVLFQRTTKVHYAQYESILE